VEWIIIDDGSQDRTLDIISGFNDPRIIVVKNEHIGLLSVIRNIGIKVSQANFIAFIDGDDLCEPTRLEEQLQVFKKDSSIGLVHTQATIFNEEKEMKIIPHIQNEPSHYFEYLIQGKGIIISSVMMKKEVIEENGLFEERKELIGTEDFEYWVRISKNTKFKFLAKPLIKYRWNRPGSLTIDKRLVMAKGAWFTIQKNIDFAKNNLQKKIVDDSQSLFLGKVGIAKHLDHDQGAKNDIFEAINFNPMRMNNYFYFILSLLPSKAASKILRTINGMGY